MTGTESEAPVIVTNGVNFSAIHQYQDAVNPNRLFTNDIAAMYPYSSIAKFGIPQGMGEVEEG